MRWKNHLCHIAIGIGFAAVVSGIAWLIDPHPFCLVPITSVVFGWALARTWDDAFLAKRPAAIFVQHDDGRIAYYPRAGRHGYWIDADLERTLYAVVVRKGRLMATALVLIVVANIVLIPVAFDYGQWLPRGWEWAAGSIGVLPAFVVLALAFRQARERRLVAGRLPAPRRSAWAALQARIAHGSPWLYGAMFFYLLVVTVFTAVTLRFILTMGRLETGELALFATEMAVMVLATVLTGVLLVAKWRAKNR